MSGLTRSLESFNSLIDRIYDCGASQTRWETMLGELAAFFEADNANILTPTQLNTEQSLWVSHHIEFEAWLDYTRYYHQCDLLAHAAHAQGMYVTGNAVTDASVLDKRRVVQSEFYTDYWRPQDIHHAIASVVCDGSMSGDELPLLVLGLYRGRQRVDFTAEDLQLVKLFNPHLQRALRTAMQLKQTHTMAAVGEALLANSPQACGICTSQGRLLYANGLMEQVLREEDGLSHRNGCLTAASAGDQERLLRIMVASTRTAPAVVDDVVAIRRPSGRASYQVRVQRLPAAEQPLGKAPRITLLVRVLDPGARSMQMMHRLGERYGLTPAECRLALRLAQGDSLKQAAETFGVSQHTARSQLKAALTKTGTHRQAELLLLLNRLAETDRGD